MLEHSQNQPDIFGRSRISLKLILCYDHKVDFNSLFSHNLLWLFLAILFSITERSFLTIAEVVLCLRIMTFDFFNIR